MPVVAELNASLIYVVLVIFIISGSAGSGF